VELAAWMFECAFVREHENYIGSLRAELPSELRP